MIAAESLRMFENQLKFTSKIDKQYSKEFAKTGAKVGNTITVRKPWRPTTRSGPAIQIQNVNEEMVPLVLSNQTGVDFTFSSQDLTLTVDQFAERYIKPAVVAVANQVDIANLQMAAQTTYNMVGIGGTAPGNQSSPTAANTLAIYLAAQQKLQELACPQDGDHSMFLNPAGQAATIAQLSGLFQSSSEIAKQYEKGIMGMAVGAEWYMSQNVYAYTSGAQGGTPTVNGAGQTGASLVTQGWSNSITNLLAIGDVFTIAGVYKVNPITKQNTGVLQQFIVTAAASSNGSGASTISISPSIITSGSTQTVTASPANSASITFTSNGGGTQTANVLTANNIMCHKSAYTFGCADMELPEGVHFAARAKDEESGLSIRIVRAYDINSDQIPCRLDILWGNAALRPEWACKVLG